MAPIRRGDGTPLTPKGISEVRKGDGTVLYTAGSDSDVPDSAIAHYDAQSAFGSGDEGSTINTWPDEFENFDLSGSDPSVVSDGINGHRSVQFDGVDDYVNIASAEFPDINHPFTILAVAEIANDDSSAMAVLHRSSSDANPVALHWDSDGSWAIRSGMGLDGSGDIQSNILTGVYDGDNSEIREDGTSVATGDVGNSALQSVELGGQRGGNYQHLDGYIGEVLICDTRLASDEINQQEQRLINKWDIAI